MEMSYAPVLPQELIVEILSRLPVNALVRLRCVSKTWNSLVLDPTFIKLHLQRSSKNTNILLTFDRDMDPAANESIRYDFAAPCSVRDLLENPLSTIDDCSYQLNRRSFVIGACNGLVCLGSYVAGSEFEEYWVRFWNPATRITSDDSPRLLLHSSNYRVERYCGFGYDDESDTYKVVVVLLDIESQNWEVRVYCLGDTCWRMILTCPVIHILEDDRGQFVSGTVNWLAFPRSSSDYQWLETATIDQSVIFSYDLKNDTYKYLLMPDGLSEVPVYNYPYLGVLNGCLCLSHDHRETHLVVWLMSEFGVEKSWTRLLNVSYEHLFPIFPPSKVMPLCMFENEDVLLLADYGRMEYVLVLYYNKRDNRIDCTEHFHDFKFSYFPYSYVQSLVLPYRN